MNADGRAGNPAQQKALNAICGKPIQVIVGGYGSGKSEVAVNLAKGLAEYGTDPVSIADLDIINPYFRSREAARELEQFGVISLIPPGAQVSADLPIVIPAIRRAIERPIGHVILDVGGDDAGAKVLSSLCDAFQPASYDMLLVLNGRRPFTSDAAGTQKMLEEIETSSRLRFTGIIGNTHLMQETTMTVIREGILLAREVSRRTGLPVKAVTVLSCFADELAAELTDIPIFQLDRVLTKPWERKGTTWTDPKLRVH